MPITANIVPTAPTDGILYCTNAILSPTEANLGDSSATPNTIAIAEGQTIVAVVRLTINGFVVTNSTFVFLQTDLGDGTWIDVAWCFFNSTQVPGTFVLCAGGLGAMNNAFQMARNPGSAPASQANGSNACPLGGRARFTGFSNISGGSATPGQSLQVNATITYRLQMPR